MVCTPLSSTAGVNAKGCRLNWFNSGEDDAFKKSSESDSGTHMSIFSCIAKNRKKREIKINERQEKSRQKTELRKRGQEVKIMKGEGKKRKIKWEKFTANEIEKLSTKKEIKQNKILR